MYTRLLKLYFTVMISIDIIGCSVLPTRLTECSSQRPCPSGHLCSEVTSTCIPVVDLGVADQNSSDRPPIDMSPPAGMILIAGGTYNMGSPLSDTGSASDERPEHDVTLPNFYIDITEVTQAAYRNCVNAGSCTQPDNYTTNANCNWGQAGREDHPANCIDWNQAKGYCEWRGSRLPTEEEWEYVARGKIKSTYPYGNEPISNQSCINTMHTCAVGQYQKTLFGKPDSVGLSDLLGNVVEWTSTLYCASYDLQGCTSNYESRGGGWGAAAATSQRAAYRGARSPASSRGAAQGVRCAKDF